MSNAQGDNLKASEVVFAVLPFCQLSPALDASTLATILRQDGIRARVIYLNRIYANEVDPAFYDAAAARVSLNSLLADWVFCEQAFGAMDDREFLKSLLDRDYISVDHIPSAIHAKATVAPFINMCLTKVPWNEVKVLCLVETFAKRDAVSGQLMASLALAKKVKDKFPHVQIILAGPSTEQEMGRALTHLSFLDFVCTGNIYSSIPSVVKDLLVGRTVHSSPCSESQIRRQFEGQNGVSTQSILNLPVPNFDDYFELKGDGLPGCFDSLPMETSKGCWWAERRHCLFCGLPGANVTFRSKTPSMVLHEFRVQIERYQPKKIEMNDLIIDQKYFSQLFPVLSNLNHNVEIFYETKAHLKKDDLALLASSGVTKIQAGIESLSPNSLDGISKGVSLARNIQFLNDCNDIGIKCYWNYLHSFPGETASDLLAAIPVIEKIMHLQPPATFQPVRVERFSPYFKNPTRFGIVNIRPDRSYEFLYRDTGIDLSTFAFYFEHDELDINKNERAMAVAKVNRAVEGWLLRFSGTNSSIGGIA